MPRFIPVKWLCVFVLLLCGAAAKIEVPDAAGKQHTPLDLHGQKAAVFIFVGVDCPISNSYAPEINRILKDDAEKGLDFYLVYSDPALSAADIKKHAAAYGYTCTCLIDHDQKLMKKMNATVTPQAAVVDGNGKVLYLGRIDDWYLDFGKKRYAATTHDLRNALDAVITGKPVKEAVTKVVGCPI